MKPSVLYVEDDPVSIVLMGMIVEHIGGFDLVTADTAEKGLEIARKQSLELILTDINLPGMSGIELIEHLKQEDGLREIPVIAVSANTINTMRDAALNAGCAAFVDKPIKIPELEATILDVMRELHDDNSS